MDGEQALDFLLRRGTHATAPRPDLVLLDLKLPRLHGFAVLDAVRARARAPAKRAGVCSYIGLIIVEARAL